MGSTFGECVCIPDVIWSYNNAVLLSEKHESTLMHLLDETQIPSATAHFHRLGGILHQDVLYNMLQG